MARIDQGGFETNSTTANVSGFETFSNGVIGTTHVRTGSRAMQITSLVSGVPRGATKKWIATGATGANGPFYLRAYVYVVTTPSASNGIMNFSNSSGTVGGGSGQQRGGIALESNGTLTLRTGSGTQIGSASAAINDGAFHMVELKKDTTAVSGSRILEARLDGTIFATSSTQTDGNALAFSLGGNLNLETQTTGEWWFDDYALNDSTGSFQNSYAGSGSIVQVWPNAVGDSNGFLVQVGGTVGSANNYTRVQENPPDDATTYNASAVLNASDLFGISSTGVGSSDTVNAVMVGARFANITGADPTSAIKLQIEKTTGGTLSKSAAIIPDSTSWNTNATTSPRNYQLVLYNDPDGNPWTSSTLGTAQIGYTISATNVDAIGVTNLWMSVDYTPAAPSGVAVAPTAMLMGFGS